MTSSRSRSALTISLIAATCISSLAAFPDPTMTQMTQMCLTDQARASPNGPSTLSTQGASSIQSRYANFLNQLPALNNWSSNNEQILLEPFKYLNTIPGKEIRSMMIEAFNQWLKIPQPELEIVKKIVGMLHTASLLMDDVEDGSDLRRGVPVAHKIYGVPQTINSANYVYFLAYQDLSKLTSSLSSATSTDLWSLVNDELLQLHRGQGMDLYWRDSLTCPTEEEYLQMVNYKTGGLFRIAIKLMMALSPLKSIPDYLPLVDLIGIIFQIRDDLLNLSSVYTKNKGFCEDLTEGKFSFPIVHSIRADTTNHRLLNVLRQRPTDKSTKTYAVSYMRDQTGSLEYTRNVLSCLQDQAVVEVNRLGGNRALENIFEMMEVLPSPPESSAEEN